MNLEELNAYEDSKGYKSFGRKSEQLYAGTDFEKFKSIDEIKAFVESNSEYLKIVEDGFGVCER